MRIHLLLIGRDTIDVVRISLKSQIVAVARSTKLSIIEATPTNRCHGY